jgi:hypothetical protein
MMDAKTLEALKASIAKWERNAEAKTPAEYKIREKDCPLCDLFRRNLCDGCPVSDRTEEIFCYGTPYDLAAPAKYDWIRASSKSAADRAHAAARDEVAFLKSLLPEAEGSQP